MISLHIEYDQVDKIAIKSNWIKEICKKIMNDNGHDIANITIIFTNDVTLHKLKKQYFKQDLYTDTITFNLEEDGGNIEGEVYISLDRIEENSEIYRQDILMECKRVIIHSFLHLVGYEDILEKDKLLMTDLEDKYLKLSNNHIKN